MDIKKNEIHYFFNIYINSKTGKKKEDIYQQIYIRYNKLVEKIAFSILKNKSDSEDVMQNVFIKIYNMPNDNLPRNNEKSWLYTITKNAAIDYLRTKKIEINIEDIYNYECDKNEIEDFIDYDNYKRLISKLSLKEQEIISLKMISNLSFKEIGSLMNIPTSTASWLYYKALNTLKTFIGNLLMTVCMMIGYIINKNNIPRAEIVPPEMNPSLEIEKILQKHNIINNIFLTLGTIFFIITLYFLIILIKYHKKRKSNSSKL